MDLLEFFKKKYWIGNEKYNPSLRAKDIIDVIRSIKQDGLKVSCKDNCIYVENTISKTVATIQFGDNGCTVLSK